MKLKVKISDPHPYPLIDGWSRTFAKALRKRWKEYAGKAMERFAERRGIGDVKKAIGDGEDPYAPLRFGEMDDLEKLLRDLMGVDTFTLTHDFIGRSFAFGAALARKGETAWYEPPTTNEVLDLASSPRFLDRQAMDFVEGYAFTQIRSKDSETFAQLSTRLLEALENRQHPSQVAHALTANIDGDEYGWTRIARTETARALAVGSFDETKRLGMAFVYVPENGDACPECLRLILGRVFPLVALESGSNFKKKKDQWKAALPLHPNCRCHSIPASQWLIDQAMEAGGGTIPAEGVKVEWVAPNKR